MTERTGSRALAGLLALLIAGLSVGAAADEHGGATDGTRLIRVGGEGEVMASPDRAQVTLAVSAREARQQAAQERVDEAIGRVLRLTRDLRIPEDRVRTTRVVIRPEYEWDQNTRQRRLTAYYVQRAVEVDLRELEKLGELMQRATSAGVNEVSPPVLDASNKDELKRQALARAAEDARANAEVLASTLGASLGAVRSVVTSDVQFQPPPIRPMLESRAMAADAKAAETYTPGEIRFSANVTVEFDLNTP